MNLPATRREAFERGEKYYFTGKPCKRGHIAKRHTCNRTCAECGNAQVKAWQEANPSYHKVRYRRKREQILARQKAYRVEFPERRAAASRKWYLANVEQDAARKRIWQKANRDKCAATLAKYRAAKLERTPSWLTDDDFREIDLFYEQSQFATEISGIQHHVDHIHPLQGESVSGLHVPWNLQVIPATENISKGNRFYAG